MLILSTSSHSTSELTLTARDMLLKGQIIAYPSETFYGIGARFDSEESLKRIYTIKRRPHERAMPLIIGSADILPMVASEISSVAKRLMEKFWPGPLTLIFKAQDNISEMITAGTGKVAVRIPGRSFALDLAKITDVPITATSANISGMPPATDADTVIRYFKDSLDAVIDCGGSSATLPSTIVDVAGPEVKILREGMIREEALLSVVG